MPRVSVRLPLPSGDAAIKFAGAVAVLSGISTLAQQVATQSARSNLIFLAIAALGLPFALGLLRQERRVST